MRPPKTSAVKRFACLKCSSDHVRCDGDAQLQLQCSRCRKRGVKCQYSADCAAKPGKENRSAEITQSLLLEDPDLRPTIQDWFLCIKWFVSDSAPVFMSFLDSTAFIDGFYNVFPPLRLMVCAHALRVQDRKVADAYVKKAEKAILRHFEVQSLPMLQALFLWVLFESWTSRWVWHSYSHRCINLVQSLQLLVDPDDLGGSMAFTAEEANERRMIAWCIYAYLKFFLVTLPLPHFGQKMILSSAKLKFGKAASFWPLHSVNRASIEAVNPKLARHETSNSGSCICLVAEVLDIIMRIKHTHKTPPATAHDIIVNPFHTHAKMDLARILMHPSASQRILTNPATLQEDLTAQFLSEPLKTATFPLTILLTAYHNASTCLLERSRVQLSSHLSLTSSLLVHGTRHASQTQSGAENIASLLSSLHAAYTAARCVAGTCVWLTSGNGVYEDLGGQRDMREQMMVEHWHIAFAFVEAAMTLWLLTCRTRKYWWATAQEDEGVLRMTLEERREIRREVVVISKWIRETQMMWNKVMGPIADCVWEMALEMEQVEDGMKETGFEVDAAVLYGRVNPDAELAGVLEGFRTLRVRDDPINSPVMTEPWAFSPLMGELIGGTLTFDSENEGAWRAFYTSVQFFRLHEEGFCRNCSPITRQSMAHASSSHSTLTPRPIPCQSCRERRVKCDYSVPNCSRCSAGGTECTYKHLAGRRYVHRKRKPASEIQLHELEVATPGIQVAEGNGLLVGTSQIGIGDLGLATNCASPGSSCASDLSGTTALLEARSDLLTSILRMADDWGKWDSRVDENPQWASGLL